MRLAFVSLAFVPLACGGLTTAGPPNETRTGGADAATPNGGSSSGPLGPGCRGSPGASCATGSSSSSGGEAASLDASSAGDAATACGLPAVEMQALMDRWNAAAMAAATPIDFTWSPCDHFPHPTYKMGTEEAYGEFATVLLQFFQQGDDFAFLANNDLFEVPLLYVFPSGQVGIDTTFKQLAASFSSPGGFGNQSAATRQALAGFLARMP